MQVGSQRKVNEVLITTAGTLEDPRYDGDRGEWDGRECGVDRKAGIVIVYTTGYG